MAKRPRKVEKVKLQEQWSQCAEVYFLLKIRNRVPEGGSLLSEQGFQDACSSHLGRTFDPQGGMFIYSKSADDAKVWRVLERVLKARTERVTGHWMLDLTSIQTCQLTHSHCFLSCLFRDMGWWPLQGLIQPWSSMLNPPSPVIVFYKRK